MKFKKESLRTYYLGDTMVENMFICEYLPDAPSNYVKVYLVALMYADSNKDIEKEDIAHMLTIPVEDVEKAWVYWQEAGLIEKDGEVFEFVNLKEKLYGKPKSKKVPIADERNRKILDNTNIKKMYDNIQKELGRFLSGSEASEIVLWIKDFGATTDVIFMAYKYCHKKNKTNYKYVGTVVKDWASRGFATIEDVNNYLGQMDEQHYRHNRVMKALGFHRNATEEERRIIDTWHNNLNCSMDQILAACNKTSGISNPNINYIDKVLNSKYGEKDKTASKSLIKKYYDSLQEEAKTEAETRKREVYNNVPAIKNIDEDLIECSMNLTKIMISGGVDKAEKIEKTREKVKELEKRKAQILTEKNIPIDYMEIKYKCNVCKDTGIKDTGEKCECFYVRAKEAEQWEEQ